MLFLTAICVLIYSALAAGGEPPPDTIYFNNSSGTLKGVLVPEDDAGFVCFDCQDVIRITVDEKEIPVLIKPTGDGRAEFTGDFPGLADGPHTATEEALDNDGKVTAVNRMSFFVDSKPPVLELVEPAGDTIPPGQTTFLVKFNDEGSGIPPIVSEMEVEAKVNNSPAYVHVSDREGSRFLLVDAKDVFWRGEQSLNLYVRLEDRAENRVELSKTFEVQESEERTETEEITCTRKDDEGETITSTKTSPLRRLVPFSILTPIKSVLFDSNTRSRTIEIMVGPVSGHTPDSSVLDSLQLVTNTPYLKLERLASPEGSSLVIYSVRQIKTAKSNKTLVSITVQYPEAVDLRYENGCKEGYPVSTLVSMDPSVPIRKYSVPVSLYWEDEFSDDIFIEDHRLKYRCSFASPGALDMAASFIEPEPGMRFWLSEVGEGLYEAEMPAKEGYRLCNVSLTSSRGAWGNVSEGQLVNGGTCLKKDIGILVKLAPPVIENFFYDRDKERFFAVLSDEGTDLGDLVLELQVSATGEITAQLDPLSGTVRAEYPLPEGVLDATLSVTDLAGQTTTATCKVFGNPPEPQQAGDGESGAPITYKVGTGGYDRRPQSSASFEYRNYLPTYRDGMQYVRECKSVTTLFTCLDSCVTSVLNMGMNLEQALSRCEHCNEPPSRHTDCTFKWIDTLAPHIRYVSYNPSTGEVSASIDDSGRLLSELVVTFSAKSPYPSRTHYEANLPYFFNTENGSFRGLFIMPPKGELFDLTINAEDRAGNYGHARISVTVPRAPPDVSLKVINPGEIISSAGTVSVCLMGEYFDDSGINHDLTGLWLDDQPVQPFNLDMGWGGTPDRVYFGARLEEGGHSARIRVTDTST